MKKQCKLEAFLDDPITQEYGVGYEMLHLVECDCSRCKETPGHAGGRRPKGWL